MSSFLNNLTCGTKTRQSNHIKHIGQYNTLEPTLNKLRLSIFAENTKSLIVYSFASRMRMIKIDRISSEGNKKANAHFQRLTKVNALTAGSRYALQKKPFIDEVVQLHFYKNYLPLKQ